MRSISTPVRLAPLIVALIYLLGSGLLLAVGPWPWPFPDPFELYAYLLLAPLCLAIGYLTAAFGTPRTYGGKWSWKRVFWCCAITTLVLLPATSKARSGSWIPNVVEGLTDPGKAYLHAQTAQDTTSWVEYLRVLLGVPLTLLLPLTVYRWRRLSRSMRIAGAVGILGYLSIFVAIGTNKALADAAILICGLGAATVLAGQITLTRRRAFQLGGAALAIVAGFLVFFSAGQFTRGGGLAKSLDVDINDVNWTSAARPPEERYEALKARGAAYGAGPNQAAAIPQLVFANVNNPLIEPLPAKLQRAAISLTGYLSEGYFGLSLAMDQPWVPTYGLGSAYFIVRNASRLLHSPSFEDRPYPMRVETHTGWDAWGRWTAFYAWVASDLSFPGTLLLMLLIGRILALSWLDTIEGSNPFAIGMFGVLVLLIAYIPANNQVFADGETAVGFVGLLILWLWTRKRPPPGVYLPIARRIRSLSARTAIAAVAAIAVVGAGTAVLLRPMPSNRFLAHATIDPAPSAAVPSRSQLTTDAAFLGKLARWPGVVSSVLSTTSSYLSTADVVQRLQVVPTDSGLVSLRVGGPTVSAARGLADAFARDVQTLASEVQNGASAGVAKLAAFSRGAFSADPARVQLKSARGRFHRVVSVRCGAVVGCGSGTDLIFPLLAGRTYRVIAWVRSTTKRPADLVLAVGNQALSATGPSRVVKTGWTELRAAWTPRQDLYSSSLAVQTWSSKRARFELGSVRMVAPRDAIRQLLTALGVSNPHPHSLLKDARFTRHSPARDAGSLTSPALPWALFGFVAWALVAGAIALAVRRRGSPPAKGHEWPAASASIRRWLRGTVRAR